MSLGEILVVAVIALLVVKPEDMPAIVQHIRQLKEAFANISNKVLEFFSKELELTETEKMPSANIEEINFYLQKIIAMQGQYHGEYSLEQVKAKYHELIKAAVYKRSSNDVQ